MDEGTAMQIERMDCHPGHWRHINLGEIPQEPGEPVAAIRDRYGSPSPSPPMSHTR